MNYKPDNEFKSASSSGHAKTVQRDNKQQRTRQMKKEITVDKAIKIIYLIGYIVQGILSLSFIVAFIYFFPSDLSIIVSILAIGIAIVLPALLSVRLSDIWIIPWAFSHVNNVHELKNRLILLVKITEEDTLLKKIENSTEYYKKYWKLRIKFAQEHIFVDDETIPEETVIYNLKQKTRSKMFIVLVIMLILFALGIFIIASAVDAEMYIGALGGVFPIIVAIFFVFFVFWGWKKNKKPQLILNSKGIISNKAGFHKWEEIWFCIISDGSLIYKHSSGGENVKFAYNEIKLSKLLWVYSERNKLH